MRAVFLEDAQIVEGERIILDGDIHRHLSKVVRIKKSETIKILNGKGSSALGVVEFIDKKQTQIVIESVSTFQDKRKFNLIVGLTKKEALEEILRKSIEIGVRTLTFVETEFSQKSFLKSDRVNNILESAYCQSNNPWKLEKIEIIKFSNLEELVKKHSSSFFMSLSESNLGQSVAEDSLLLIGPEGGFSSSEESQLKAWGVDGLRLEMPIMRAPTAAVCGVGFLHCALKG